MLKTKILFIFFFFSFFSLSFTQDNSILSKVRQTINNAKPFKVDFIQQVYIDNELEIEEKGEILFKNVSKIRWTYTSPDYKVCIINEGEYQFYDREDNQVIINKINKENKKWIWQILFSDEISGFIKCDEKKRKIYIKKASEDLDFEISIGKNWLPVKVIQKDQTGAKYIYVFEKYRKRAKVNKKDFLLKLPKDVDIINMQ